jgi:hypothetical protein
VSSKIKKVMEDKRSPLKSKPLRNPGQSLREQRVDVIFNKVMAPVMMSLLFLLWAALEWIRYFFPGPNYPWVSTCIALGSVVYAIWQFLQHWPKVKVLRLAEEGEKAVGQFLDTLRGRCPAEWCKS